MLLQKQKSCQIKQKINISNIEEKTDLKISAVDPTLKFPEYKDIEDEPKKKILSPLKKRWSYKLFSRNKKR